MHTFSNTKQNFPNGGIDIISTKQVDSKVCTAYYRARSYFCW